MSASGNGGVEDALPDFPDVDLTFTFPPHAVGALVRVALALVQTPDPGTADAPLFFEDTATVSFTVSAATHELLLLVAAVVLLCAAVFAVTRVVVAPIVAFLGTHIAARRNVAGVSAATRARCVVVVGGARRVGLEVARMKITAMPAQQDFTLLIVDSDYEALAAAKAQLAPLLAVRHGSIESAAVDFSSPLYCLDVEKALRGHGMTAGDVSEVVFCADHSWSGLVTETHPDMLSTYIAGSVAGFAAFSQWLVAAWAGGGPPRTLLVLTNPAGAAGVPQPTLAVPSACEAFCRQYLVSLAVEVMPYTNIRIGVLAAGHPPTHSATCGARAAEVAADRAVAAALLGTRLYSADAATRRTPLLATLLGGDAYSAWLALTLPFSSYSYRSLLALRKLAM